MTSDPTRGAGTPRRIVIVKLAALGDIVMASTLVDAIRTRWPAAHLTWVVGEAHAALVRRFVGVDDVRTIPADTLLAGRGLDRLIAGARSVARIGLGPWDVAFVGHSDSRYAELLRFAGVGEVRMFSGIRAPRPERWFGAEYARLVWEDGDATPRESLRANSFTSAGGFSVSSFDASSSVVADAPPQLATLNWPAGIPPARARARHVLLAPGGARNVLRDDHLRRWPAEKWGALAARLIAEGCRVTVIGGAGDRAEADAVAAAVRGVVGSSGAFDDLVGTLPLEGTLELIARSDLLVTHDSGPLHLAALTRTPAVALFGPTDPQQFVAPKADVTVMSAAAGLECAPCYDGKGYAPCGLNRCLTDVSVNRVAGAVLDRVMVSYGPPMGVGAEGLEPPTSAV
jgi:ADP-heptose:LPS heptosyltransferase